MVKVFARRGASMTFSPDRPLHGPTFRRHDRNPESRDTRAPDRLWIGRSANFILTASEVTAASPALSSKCIPESQILGVIGLVERRQSPGPKPTSAKTSEPIATGKSRFVGVAIRFVQAIGHENLPRVLHSIPRAREQSASRIRSQPLLRLTVQW